MKLRALLISISTIFISIPIILFAQQQEQITITTYYPSPYGSYHEVRSDQMAIGSPYRTSALADGNLLVSGNVGIGTATPAVALEVRGPATGAVKIVDGNQGVSKVLTSDANGLAKWAPGVPPSGSVGFFDLASCPAGWSAFAAARGRYIVGLVAGGTLDGVQGTALSNLENRPVGRHRHHVVYNVYDGGGFKEGSDDPFPVDYTPGTAYWTHTWYTSDDGLNQNVPGTNAPYIQLLVCRKD